VIKNSKVLFKSNAIALIGDFNHKIYFLFARITYLFISMRKESPRRHHKQINYFVISFSDRSGQFSCLQRWNFINDASLKLVLDACRGNFLPFRGCSRARHGKVCTSKFGRFSGSWV